MQLRVLGAVEAVDGDQHRHFDGAKPRTVVATLALANGRTVPDSRLSAMLWGTHPPATASSQIYTYMSRLRKQLGPDIQIVRQAPGYALDLGVAGFDLAEFERLRKLGQDRLAAGQHDQAADRLGAALSLWRGRAISDVTAFLAEAEGPHLEDLRVSALEGRVEAELALGRHGRLVSELTGLVAEHPLRERLRAQLMTALYRDNRQAEALSLYDSGRKLLADELGIAPGAVLERVFHAILRGADPAPTPGRVVSQVDVRPAMLPADISDFTGRTAQLATLAESAGWFVITGMAGVGKTALAVHAAHACAAKFPDGQLYVDLGGAEGRSKNPAQVLAAFLRALGTDESAIPDAADERSQLYRSRLAGRRMLVVLDNAGSGTQLNPLLPGAATCRVLVTARRHPVVLTGARTIGLDVPEPEETLALLTEIVGAGRVAEEPEAAKHLGELCGHLPLAIRVAAAPLAARPDRPISHLVRRLTAAPSILDELTFAELEVRGRLAHSCRGLPGHQHAALRRLATLDAPELPLWVAAQVLCTSPAAAEFILDDLIEARLVQVARPDANGQPRFRIHVLVRQLIRDLDRHGSAMVLPAARAAVPG